MRKFLSVLLALTMIVSSIATVAFAAPSAISNVATAEEVFEVVPDAAEEAEAELKADAQEDGVDVWDGTVDTSWYNETDTEFTLTTAEQFAGFAKLVDEWEEYDETVEGYLAFEGVTIKLGANIDLENKVFNPIGSYRKDKAFSGTFDGNGKTIMNLSQDTWSLDTGYYYDDLGLGLFGLVYDATIKNLTVDGANISGESGMCGTIAAAAYGNCIFDGITIKNANVADYQYYAGGIVGWASGNHQYIGCRVEESTTVAGQWGDFDCSLGGVIGGCGSSAEVLMKDCYVACCIDATSDVVSSYQWYAYRRAGMLIGNTNQTSQLDGTTYAVSSQITVDNCTVVFGDWANYTYCQFAGTNWPWVRVQAGLSNSAYSNIRYGHPTDAAGNEVVDDNHVHNDGEGHFERIVFDQFFGGGQGVYGPNLEELEDLGFFDGEKNKKEDLEVVDNSVHSRRAVLLYAPAATLAAVESIDGYIFVDSFETLEEALAVVDNGEMIVLNDDIEYNNSNASVSGEWKDGLVYTGDKSFTIDLNGYTISENGDLNDYLIYFKNEGTTPNEITIKNGEIKGGANLWNVITVSKGSEVQPTTLNLGEGLVVTADCSSNSGEAGVVKVRGTSVLNILDGAKVVSEDALYGVQASSNGATANIYDGAEIVNNDTSGAAVTGVGTMNIYGGTITAAGTGVHTSTSGTPVANIMGGTITAPVAVVSSADVSSYPDANPTVNITDGTINGEVKRAVYGTDPGNIADVVISGGTFTQEPAAEFIADGFEVKENSNGTFGVEADVPALTGAGTQADPYVINNLNDLKAFRDDVNDGNTYEGEYVALMADIDLTGEVWTPIGTSNYDKVPADAKMFAGNFDGGNHTITGLSSYGYVPASSETQSTEYCFGLFGYVYGANISNVKLADVDINGSTRLDSDGNEVYGSGVAALIGYYVPENDAVSVIENCHVLSGTVKASNNMGGLIGHMDSQISQPKVDITIKDCSNDADVTTEAREAGGILGLLNGSREGNLLVVMRGTIVFDNCVNTGDITALGGGAPSAGGILGRDNAAFTGQRLKVIFDGCENSGTITVTANGEETHAAGIGSCFYSHGSWMISKNSINTGDVVVINPVNDVYAGGLISYGGVVELIDSTSTGSVTVGTQAGNKYVGGAQSILFLEKMNDCTDVVNGNTYYLNGGTSPEYAALVDDAAGGGNFHLVETAYKDGFAFGGWYDNASLTGEAYTALVSGVKTYYAKWIGPVAKIGNVEYDTLQAAIGAAQDGETVTLINSINLADETMSTLDGQYNTYFRVAGKSVTVDMNGYTISGEYNNADMLVGVFSTEQNGHLTLTGNGKVDITAAKTVYSLLVNYDSTSTLTVENGVYKADKVKDSLVYSGRGAVEGLYGNTISGVTINGGTFTLGNIDNENGPWIFNVGGSGDSYVTVNGGTFNYNIAHQKWVDEVNVSKNCYMTDNADGTWTVTDGAQVTLNDTVLSGPYALRMDFGYPTLEAALADAESEDVITLIKDINAVVVMNNVQDLTLDLNGFTFNGAIKPSTGDITIKNGSIVNTNSSYSAIEINSGSLTLENVNIDSARHAVRIDGDVTAVVNGGTYKTIVVAPGVTQHAFNISGNADVTINDGTFTGPAGTASDSGSAINVKTGSVVTINGGNFSGGKRNTLSASGTLTVYGGTFDQDPASYVADDYFAYTETGTYVVEEKKVAKIGDVKYKTLQDAVDAAQAGDTIVIRNDFELDTKVNVANGKKITLDLNGKTITGTDNNTAGNFYLLDNRGDLTITGEGKITLTATTNREWNASSVVVANNPGGKLTVNGGTLEHLGGTDMAYGIDNLTNGKGTYAETVVNGGVVKSTYRAIRQFLNGIEAQNILTINGGTVEGANKSVWMQDPSAKANSGTLKITDGATLNGDVYLYVTPGSTEWPVTVNIAKSAVNGQVLTGNVPLGYALRENNGYYGVVVISPDAYAVTAIADKDEVRFNNGNVADTFTVKYVVTGGNVIAAMALLKYDNELFICEQDTDGDGLYRFDKPSLTTDAEGKTELITLNFKVKKNPDTTTSYEFKPEYVQVVSDFDAAGSGAQDGYVDNVVGDVVTVVTQYNVTLPADNSLAGETIVDEGATYTATINNFETEREYTVKYTMGGTDCETTVTTDTVTITNVTGDIVFTEITSEADVDIVLVKDYITNHTLVMVKDGDAAGYTYNGDTMYRVERYEGLTQYSAEVELTSFEGDILGATKVHAIVIEGAVTVEEARKAIKAATTTSTIDKSYDVNANGAFFYNDAVTAYGCYYRQYNVETQMVWYLSADVDTSFKVDTFDYSDAVTAYWATIPANN